MLHNALYHHNENGTNGIGLVKIICYFLKLYLGMITGQIYFKEDSKKYKNVPFETDGVLKTIDDGIKNMLQKIELKNVLDLSKNLGFEHIGYGCFVTNVFGKKLILTQGNATFYFSTTQKQSHVLKITFQSITNILVKVKIFDTVLSEINLQALTKREVVIKIHQDLILDSISKIIISTDRLWSPHFLEKQKPNIPVGVGILKIEMRQDTITD